MAITFTNTAGENSRNAKLTNNQVYRIGRLFDRGRAAEAIHEFHRVMHGAMESEQEETHVTKCELIDGNGDEIDHVFVVASYCGLEETVLVSSRGAELIDDEFDQ